MYGYTDVCTHACMNVRVSGMFPCVTSVILKKELIKGDMCVSTIPHRLFSI